MSTCVRWLYYLRFIYIVVHVYHVNSTRLKIFALFLRKILELIKRMRLDRSYYSNTELNQALLSENSSQLVQADNNRHRLST